MTERQIRAILDAVAAGKTSAAAAMRALRELPFQDLGFAKLDHHRNLRRGIPEVIFGENKTAAQIITIGRAMISARDNFIISRLSPEKARAVRAKIKKLTYYPAARLGAVMLESPRIAGHGEIMVVSAGTSDLPVAEEAATLAELFGNRVSRLYDIGVAGLHRLTSHLDQLRRAGILIVVAGMEGALPSVVAGLIDKPVIAVPTSIGYGASFHGMAALLGMLNTCAGGVMVVNIDNGFGAAVAATLINRIGIPREGGG
jgi:pyridinium-3,5-biscarboxylic acid mononucleotide synthase